mmetsp:Transcript_6205/g.9049  ORF Transcript_6205/g.9049 Transcript_6205/m.9049 type:complete len:109 (+) Transcript_6205:65-391(+)|eukprot:CAMPEP_0196802036 /NCGR_PEP_ID=MMETSP1362-20130617/1765_1 /TAXON_ID=163516 /ORGANISM="Leptocylindrus danicus, Strain CCMP1856" /LENGTH=108 /DNA_ID=CAMNT_0042173243 /DNA_START=15 /DNA_END=341 /DNA_ORIENTATION=-
MTDSSAPSPPKEAPALCIDSSGLCVGKRGVEIDSGKSGNFAAALSLASRLETGDGSASIPLLSIEAESFAYLVKEYDGNTVVLKVPTVVAPDTSQGKQSEGDQGGGSA